MGDWLQEWASGRYPMPDTRRPRLARPGASAADFIRVRRRSSSAGAKLVRLRIPSTWRMTAASAAVGSRNSRRQPSSSPSCVTVEQPASRIRVCVQCSGDRQATYVSHVCPSPHVWIDPWLPLMHHAPHSSRRSARSHAPRAASRRRCSSRSASASVALSYVSLMLEVPLLNAHRLQELAWRPSVG